MNIYWHNKLSQRRVSAPIKAWTSDPRIPSPALYKLSKAVFKHCNAFTLFTNVFSISSPGLPGDDADTDEDSFRTREDMSGSDSNLSSGNEVYRRLLRSTGDTIDEPEPLHNGQGRLWDAGTVIQAYCHRAKQWVVVPLQSLVRDIME